MHPLLHVRSASTYVLRGAALLLVLSVVSLPLYIVLGEERDECAARGAGDHCPLVRDVCRAA